MKKIGKPTKTTESNIILVSNIPASKNAISRVYNYFKKYGRIISIWAEGTEATIVYESTISARKALNDPMSLLNNRFIKIQYWYQQNKCKANLRQYIDNERVDKFSKEVNDNIQTLIQNTEKLKKELFEQNRLKNQQAKLSLHESNENKEIQLDESNKYEKDEETLRKIAELQKQKTKLVIEAAKLANDEEGSSEFQSQIQSYKDQIEEIQAKIDLYQYEGNYDYNLNENAENEFRTINIQEETEIVCQDVDDDITTNKDIQKKKSKGNKNE